MNHFQVQKIDKEINVNEERMFNIIHLRKRNLNQKLLKARQRKFDISNLNKININNGGENIKKIIRNDNNINYGEDSCNSDWDREDGEDDNNEVDDELVFNEDDYLIDPDDLDINENIKNMDFVETDNIINNITVLLNDTKNLNSILYGLLMMRKFTVIDAVLINKSQLFIQKNLYIKICSLLFDYCNINKKLVFESLWILSSFVYDSDNKDIYHFLLNDKCIDLYKKIIYSNNNKKQDLDIFLEEICTLLLNLLIFKQKEIENENNIINCDYNDEYLINFLNGLSDIILKTNIKKEIYISLFIQITNCFNLNKLLKNNFLNKIIIFLIEEIIKKLTTENYRYSNLDDDINIYYEDINFNSNIKHIKDIYQISLIQLQYILIHPLKEMPYEYFHKLSQQIIRRVDQDIDDKINNIFYVGYINCYISYILEINYPISYEETKKLFDYIITNIKNKKNKKNSKILIELIEALNNLSIKMNLNKLIGLLISELSNSILLFIENINENHISIKVVNEVLNLIITLLIDNRIKFYYELENQIFIDTINCIKNYYDCEINNDIKELYEKVYTIVSRIIEINTNSHIKNDNTNRRDNLNENMKCNDYIFLFDKMGMKDITYNLINMNSQIKIPHFLLNNLNIKI